MEFIDEKLNDYCLQHSCRENKLLQELNRETHLKVLSPRMLSGHLQGRFLSIISKMIRPMNILEIGTYTGYSAICLAEGLPENGVLTTIDINAELETLARKYFKKSGFEKKINYVIGDAKKIIPTLNVNYDMVFIDADKLNYSLYYDLVFDKIKCGGYIIADNVLWSGKVIEDKAKMDKDTLAIDNFNKKVSDDNRVENALFPLRDGLMVIRKI